MEQGLDSFFQDVECAMPLHGDEEVQEEDNVTRSEAARGERWVPPVGFLDRRWVPPVGFLVDRRWVPLVGYLVDRRWGASGWMFGPKVGATGWMFSGPEVGCLRLDLNRRHPLKMGKKPLKVESFTRGAKGKRVQRPLGEAKEGGSNPFQERERGSKTPSKLIPPSFYRSEGGEEGGDR
ncbi:hypothetical protein Taro_026654, partial [Colocasia esculenta]|nr:hypothetical protein [Colocasia esculenta]